MINTRGPRELFEQGLTLLLAKEMDRFVELFAEDAEFELPFAAPGTIRRLTGRESLRDYLADYPQRLDIGGFPAVLIHQTEDPEVIVVEFTADGTTVRTGQPYRLDYISVIRVRDGLVVGWRDYWSPLAVAAAAGERLP